jgi:hypothetical protein
MSVLVSSFAISASGTPVGSPFSLYRFGREGVRTVGSGPAVFNIEHAAAGANKVISGTVTSSHGSRVTFPAAFTYRCYGLSVQHLDDISSVNWDYNTGYHGGEVTIVYASGSYDAAGFTLYANFSYLSGVSSLSGNFSFCYTAWGI